MSDAPFTQFSIVPPEMALDDRLTKMQLRVLIALLSFRNKNTDTVWPTREKLKLRCGYDIRTISRVTGQLEKLGWLEKEGKGGFSKSCEYRITVPDLNMVSCETVAEPATVDNPATVAEPATFKTQHLVTPEDTGPKTVAEPATVDNPATVAESGTKTVAELATGNEQTIEQTKNNNTTRGEFSMYLAWRPSQVVFEFPIMRTIPDQFIEEQIGPFVAFWFSRQQGGRAAMFQVGAWDSKFMDSCVKRWRWAQTQGWSQEAKGDFVSKVTDRSWATMGFHS